MEYTIFTVDDNGYGLGYKDILRVPRNPALGTRKVQYMDKILLWNYELDLLDSDEEEVTLINWGNVFINNKDKTIKLNLDGDFKKTKHKLLWISCDGMNLINVVSYNMIDDEPIYRKFVVEDGDINFGEYIQILRFNHYYIKDNDDTYIQV